MKVAKLWIEQTYNTICNFHKKYLEQYGVKLPKLKNNSGKYTKDALVLVYLAKDYPDTKIVTKQQLTEFVKSFYPEVNDVQQGRHLGKQDGWYIISGTRGDTSSIKIAKGSYKLISLKQPHPSFIKDRRTGIVTDDFEELKKQYDYRCAVCGSKEGEPHRIRKGEIVVLQQGHMDPNKDLLPGNIIPQCQICNRPDRNRWIYDATGRVIHIANTEDGFRVVKSFIDIIDNDKREKLLKYIKHKLKK